MRWRSGLPVAATHDSRFIGQIVHQDIGCGCEMGERRWRGARARRYEIELRGNLRVVWRPTSFQKPQAKPKWIPVKTSATRPRVVSEWPRAKCQLAPASTSTYISRLVSQSQPR